ncbi:MAG: long-chain fatty acid--CoA ligase, partial [Bacteroidetes bacterium]
MIKFTPLIFLFIDMTKITRTFDILTNAEEKYNYDDFISIKRNGKWESFSTAEYRKQVDKFSLGLLAMDFKKGDKIATVMNNRPEWNFIDFGMSQIGCVHVNVYPTISETEYRHILSHSDAKILIVANSELYEKLKPVFDDTDNLKEIYTIDEVEGVKNWKEIGQLGITKEKELRSLLEKRRDDVQPDDLLTLIYTSGTTGLSKGVMLTHKNVVSNLLMVFRFTDYLKPGDKALSFLPLSHVLERTGNYFWQAKGLRIYYAESIDTIGENMKEIKVNTFITVPRVFEKVYDKIINKGRELPG